jgi:hypothetical protein
VALVPGFNDLELSSAISGVADPTAVFVESLNMRPILIGRAVRTITPRHDPAHEQQMKMKRTTDRTHTLPLFSPM